jgi:hypothetical protein
MISFSTFIFILLHSLCSYTTQLSCERELELLTAAIDFLPPSMSRSFQNILNCMGTAHTTLNFAALIPRLSVAEAVLRPWPGMQTTVFRSSSPRISICEARLQTDVSPQRRLSSTRRLNMDMKTNIEIKVEEGGEVWCSHHQRLNAFS